MSECTTKCEVNIVFAYLVLLFLAFFYRESTKIVENLLGRRTESTREELAYTNTHTRVDYTG